MPRPSSVSSRALAGLPPYPFVELERKAAQWDTSRGRLIDLSIGDPDLRPPSRVVRAAQRALRDPETHRYPTSRGGLELRQEIAAWMRRRFGVHIDPVREVAVLSGSKEAITNFPRALLDPGDATLVPDPGYPPYARGTLLALGNPLRLPLDPERGFLPDWEKAPPGGRLVFLNYPNNPTGEVISKDQLRPSLDEARARGAWMIYDNAYSELTYGDYRAPSILEFEGAIENAVEVHSMSKTFGVAGWRIGFAVGNADALEALVKLKSQADSGLALPMQRAALEALRMYTGPEPPPEVRQRVRKYGRRMNLLVRGLRAKGYQVRRAPATLYLWQRVGDGGRFAQDLLERHGILVTPGGAFGEAGREYVRWSITRPEEEIREALDRIDPAAQVPASAGFREGAGGRI